MVRGGFLDPESRKDLIDLARVDGCLNPRLSGAGARIAAKLGGADVTP